MCDVCKRKAVNYRRFFNEVGIKGINLCEAHDREMFLIGETRFLTMHKQQLSRKIKTFCPKKALETDHINLS